MVIVFVGYAGAICYLFLYGLSQVRLVWAYLSKKTKPQKTALRLEKITIQLPIYNEMYVIKRLFRAIAALEYPIDLFEVQILDDSTDGTSALIDEAVVVFEEKKIHYSILRRSNRQGFKAGALAEGLKVAKGDFIAIFDADFLPKSDFLTATIQHFDNENIGLVQTRWTHTNEQYSILTRLQAFGLDAHFRVEQGGRNQAGHCINFNGTAGIWRKTCIEDAGGWQDTSITEDLDLSYRAQMKGWRFCYDEAIESPAELPIEINAIRSQQFRWTKGAAECAKLLVVRLMQSKKLSLSDKIMGFFHLMNSGGYVLMVFLGLSSFWVTKAVQWTTTLQILASFFQINWLILLIFYGVSFKQKTRGTLVAFIIDFSAFMLLMAGLALQNALGVLEAWLGLKTDFIRTPKFNLEESNSKWFTNQYLRPQIKPIVWFEISYLVYCFWVIYNCIALRLWGLLPFYVMISGGLLFLLFYTFKHAFWESKISE